MAIINFGFDMRNIGVGSDDNPYREKYSRIPSELKVYDNWVLWRYSERQNGKQTKLPFDMQGHIASVTNKNQRSSFESVLKTLWEHNQACASSDDCEPYDGIGFVLTKDDPFVFIDLDQTDIPANIDLQNKICEEFSNTYSERSPSGKGLHIICRGEIPSGKRRYACEIYDTERYMTMTGDVWNDAPVADCNDKAVSLYESLKGNTISNGEASKQNEDQSEKYTDDQIIEKAMRASNGDKFKSLWEGQWQGFPEYPSQSEADQALVNMLMFYSENDEQTRRLFLASALGQRDKAKRKDYQNRMINAAHDMDGMRVDLDKFAALMKQKFEPFKTVDDWADVNFHYGVNDITYPPGLVGDVARYIENSATCKVKLYALIAAYGFMAGLAGRAYNVFGNGLNIYAIVLGNSGSGKDMMRQGIGRLNSHIMKNPEMVKQMMFNPRGPVTISSGQALFKDLHQNKSVCSMISEFSNIYRALTAGDYATDNMSSLRTLLLDLYSGSGKGSEVGGIIYSDKSNDVKPLDAPAFSLIGETADEDFWPGVTGKVVRTGFLPRFLIFEYTGKQLYKDFNRDVTINKKLGDDIISFAKQCNEYNQSNQPMEVQWTDEALAASKAFDDSLRDDENDLLANFGELGKNTAALANRVSLNAVKLAALTAVGECYWAPKITLACFEYAKELAMLSYNNLKKRFMNQDVAIEDFESKQLLEMKKYIGKFLKMDAKEIKKNRFNPQFGVDKVIPMAFLQTRLSQLKCFRADKLGAGKAMDRALVTLKTCGIIDDIKATTTEERYGTRQKCFVVLDPDAILEALKTKGEK